MIVAAHQPHYLPWLGYLDRMRQADLFVILDHVQFERRGYQNRTRVLVDGQPQWLTVPVEQRSQQERIIDKQIANPPADDKKSWASKHYQTLRHAYRQAPFFADYAPQLRQILESPGDRLADLNERSLLFLREAFDIRTPMVKSSELNIQGARSDMILNVCQVVGADIYLAGLGGSRDYLDRSMFADAGIAIAWQEFDHPRYAQCGKQAFVPGLSAIDLLFNHAPLSGTILRSKPCAATSPALA
jgi:WbqC-like protein family